MPALDIIVDCLYPSYFPFTTFPKHGLAPVRFDHELCTTLRHSAWVSVRTFLSLVLKTSLENTLNVNFQRSHKWRAFKE